MDEKYYQTLLNLKDKGVIIEELYSTDSGVHFEIIELLVHEGLARAKSRTAVSEFTQFRGLFITSKGHEYISSYEKTHAPWYKKALRWENIERGMKLTKFFGWLFIFAMGFLSGKYFS